MPLGDNSGHPRGAGTYARVLGKFVREEHKLELTIDGKQVKLFSVAPRDARALYDLALGWMQRALAAPQLPAGAEADALLAFAMGGLRRGA